MLFNKASGILDRLSCYLLAKPRTKKLASKVILKEFIYEKV